MFLYNIDENAIAAIDDKLNVVKYADLFLFSNAFFEVVKKRTLIFVLADNSIASLFVIYSSFKHKIVPLLLNPKMDRGHLERLIYNYCPEYIWVSNDFLSDFDYEIVFTMQNGFLLKTGLAPNKLYHDLSLLLPTSGTTGGNKLVRHSYGNLSSSVENVSKVFELTGKERALLLLPLHYTMGLSVMMSHLYSGATLLLTDKSIMSKQFWDFFKGQKATSVTGVPYVFEVFNKLGFLRMDLPDLKVISQGGGKLNEGLFLSIAKFAQETGRKFIATYGQTEGTGRMSYLHHSLTLEKVGSIGNAIPCGKFDLCDAEGNLSADGPTEGELVFYGPTVTLGYAQYDEDLAKGDERNGVLYTGDIARRDSNGCLYIIGRVSRFLKLFGIRVSLDEVEHLVENKFSISCACSGNDQKMHIYLEEHGYDKSVLDYISEITGIFPKAFEVKVLPSIPRTVSGKVMYGKLGSAV